MGSTIGMESDQALLCALFQLYLGAIHNVNPSSTSGNTLAQYIYDDKGQLTAIEKGGAIYYTHTVFCKKFLQKVAILWNFYLQLSVLLSYNKHRI